MKTKTAVIFGGTGFIGKILTHALVKRGYVITVPSRHVQSAYAVKTGAKVGQIVPMQCNFTSESVDAAIPADTDLVVNLIGVLSERKKGGFKHAHTDIPAMIAKACTDKNIGRFVHVSALAVDKAQSNYAKTKLAGEKAVLGTCPSATILRPSVIFGPEDDFFNRFAQMSIIFPFLPLIGGGHSKFQPVYVGDVVEAILNAAAKDDAKGKIYELGGSETVDFKAIYTKMFTYTKRPRPLLSLPWAIARIQAAFMGLLPNPPLTADQLRSLKTDNVVSDGALTLRDLGIEATAMDVILPQYLCRFQPGGTFGDKKAA